MLEFYDGDVRNMVIPEETVCIVGEELKTLGLQNTIESDKTLCVRQKDNASPVTLSMPDTVRYIGAKAFENCSELKEIFFSKNLEIIKLSAFLNCKNLKKIHLPVSLKEIESWAFRQIDEVEYDGSIFQFEKIKLSGAFENIGKLICSDCIVDFSKDKYYMDSVSYNGTKSEYKKLWQDSWITRRTRKVICSDGIIECNHQE